MSYKPPTLEGRAMVDLGQQLTAMRARAEQAEADNARLRQRCEEKEAAIQSNAIRYDADNKRLRAALEAAKDFIVSFGQQTCLTEDRLFKKIDAALSHTPPATPPCDDPDDGLHPADHVEDRGQRATA